MLCPFSRLTSSRFSPMAYGLSSHRFLVSLTVLDVGLSSETALKSSQNLIGYPVTFMPLLYRWAYLARQVIIVAQRAHR